MIEPTSADRKDVTRTTAECRLSAGDVALCLDTLDRAAIADLIQATPSEGYTLALRREDGRWRSGTVGDLTGREVLDLVESGSMLLCLHDVGDRIGRRFSALAPVVARLGDSRSLGLTIASPRLDVALAAASTSGAVVPLLGSMTLRLAPSGASGRADERIVIGRGELHYRSDVTVHDLEIGDGLMVALTCFEARAVGRDGFPTRLMAALYRLFGGRRRRDPVIGIAPIGGSGRSPREPMAFRLVRGSAVMSPGGTPGDHA